ncbi:Sco-Spondin [Manis pentadactyla]|nr:Sco-Spondin [Manis pentadactyla]
MASAASSWAAGRHGLRSAWPPDFPPWRRLSQCPSGREPKSRASEQPVAASDLLAQMVVKDVLKQFCVNQKESQQNKTAAKKHTNDYVLTHSFCVNAKNMGLQPAWEGSLEPVPQTLARAAVFSFVKGR